MAFTSKGHYMSIYNKLFDWQKSIVDSFKHRSAYGLFLQMGLGKTPISLAMAEQNKCDKVLVVSIKSKAVETENEEGSFFYWAKQSDIPYELYDLNYTGSFNENPSLYLVNYSRLYKRNLGEHKKTLELRDEITAFINSCKNKRVAIIIDESHKVKNLQSKQTKAITLIKRNLMFRADRVYIYLLTGTPFTTEYVDTYSQLKLLGYPETKTNFVNHFCIKGNKPGLIGWQQPIVGYKNVDELFRTIHAYSITMESAFVLKNMPKSIFVNHEIPISADMISFIKAKDSGTNIANTFIRHHISDRNIIHKYNQIQKKVNNPFYRDIAYRIYEGDGAKYGLTEYNSNWIAETSGAFWLRARQLSIGFQGNSETSYWFDRRRLNALKKFLEQNEDNYIIFYNYTPELLEIYDICEKLGYNIDVYCGEIKSLNFYNAYSSMPKEQQITNNKNVIISNFASGSTGKNWQAYNQCIMFSVPLYKDYEQSMARINRIGQTKTVIYHRFYQKSWLDLSMIKALNEQKQYSSDMFESDLIRIQEMIERNNEDA